MKYLLLFLTIIPAFAFTQIVDDSDLGVLQPIPLEDTDYFRADRKVVTPGTRGGYSVEIWIDKEGELRKIETPAFETSVNCGQNPSSKFYASALIEHPKIRMINHKKEQYEILLNGECSKHYKLIFDYQSFGGQAMGVWDLALKVYQKFKELKRLDFWTKPIQIVFMARGNFYDWESVHVNGGHQWDIVGHEIGHAIYHMAEVGDFGAGPHFIDKCYDPILALSEGWASFFSAWLSISLTEGKAEFPYMVPRRAPISVETVPPDVCPGESNEWRVFAFLWDLIDRHNDGEKMQEEFIKLWDLTRGQMFQSLSEVKEHLKNRGFDPILLEVIWSQTVLGKTL